MVVLLLQQLMSSGIDIHTQVKQQLAFYPFGFQTFAQQHI